LKLLKTQIQLRTILIDKMGFKLLNWAMYHDKELAEKRLEELKKEGHNVELRELKPSAKNTDDFKWGIYKNAK